MILSLGDIVGFDYIFPNVHLSICLSVLDNFQFVNHLRWRLRTLQLSQCERYNALTGGLLSFISVKGFSAPVKAKGINKMEKSVKMLSFYT